MDLSIVITTRNRKKDLLECIDSVKKTILKDIKFEYSFKRYEHK